MQIASNGAFAFPDLVASGATYEVAIKTQPAAHRELCALTYGSGTIGGTSTSNVSVDCTTVLGFVYKLNPADKLITGYGIHPQTGALLPIGTSIVAGSYPSYFIASPAGTNLYASNSPTDAISTFSVGADKGALALVGAPVPTGLAGTSPREIVITNSGRFLYVNNAGTSNIAAFSVDTTSGSLTDLGISVPYASGHYMRFAIAGGDSFLYVLDINGSTRAAVSITGYTINAVTGGLTQVTSILPNSATTDLFADPLGRFLYAAIDQTTPQQSSSTALPYGINPITGSLSVSAPGTTVDASTAGWAIDPSGKFAYLLDNQNATAAYDRVLGFTIDQATGALTRNGPPMPTSGIPAMLQVSKYSLEITVEITRAQGG